jgi:hypothetical protein
MPTGPDKNSASIPMEERAVAIRLNAPAQGTVLPFWAPVPGTGTAYAPMRT